MEQIVDIQKDIDWLSLVIEERVKDINFDFNSILPENLSSNSFY